MKQFSNGRNWRIYFLPLAILGASVLMSSVILVQAQTDASSNASSTVSAPQGIAFPIPELGGCGSKDECKNYCNAPEHMEACIAFAKAHGLMNKDEASRADNFRKTLQVNGGPGGCTTPDSCNAFCGDVKNLDACVKFAQDHGFKNPESDRAQKILSYMQSGGTLPGGCTSKETCETYCGDFTHAGECQAFAAKTGMTETGQNNIPSGQFQKFLELVKSGQTPGGCKSKGECESYCKDSPHLQECLDFGKKAGFISEDSASKLQQLGGKGPGGCDSPEACSTYCNDAAHQQECFRFAKDHNLIPQEQLDQAKNGLVRIREGFSQAPPEVAACLQSQLGQDTLDQIQAGTLTPGPDVAAEMKTCFEKFGVKSDPGEIFKNAPPDAAACLKEKLGANFDALSSGQAAPTPEIADAARVCFQQQEVRQQGAQGNAGMPARSAADFLRSAPPGVASCLQQKLGGEFDKLKSGETQGGPEVEDIVRGCLEEFRPGMMPQKPEMPQGQENQGQFRQHGFSSFPPGVADCLKQKVGADAFAAAQNGGVPTAGFEEAMHSCMQQGGGMTPAGSSSSAPFRSPRGSEGVAPRPDGGPSSTFQFHPPFGQPEFFKSDSHGAPPAAPQSDSFDPVTMCAKSGGIWTGNTCQMPSSEQPPQPSFQSQPPSQPFPQPSFQFQPPPPPPGQ